MAQNASTVAQQQAAALDAILEVLARHDTETSVRIQALFARGARKWSVRTGAVDPQDEALTILLEAVASLSKRVDGLTAELEATRPRRGRPKAPPKATFPPKDKAKLR